MSILNIILAVLVILFLMKVLETSAKIVYTIFELVFFVLVTCVMVYVGVTVLNWLIGEVTVLTHF